MPNKLKAKKTKSNNFSSEEKLVTIQHHHSKPYRKHHLGLLAFFSIAFIIFLITLVQYRTLVTAGVRDSLDFVAGLFNANKSYDLKVTSSYGYNFTYDQKRYYASAIDTVTGDLLIGSDLASTRPYGIVRIAKSDVNSEFSSGAVTITYHYDKQYDVNKLPTTDDLNNLAISDAKMVKASFDKSESTQTTLGSKPFTKTTWALKPQSGSVSSITSKYNTYVGMLNNKPITIVVSYGLDGQSKGEPFKEIIDSLNFSSQTAYIPNPSSKAVSYINTNRTMLDSLLAGNIASATTNNQMSGEKLSALNSPAVVKIYNAYCKDVSVSNGSNIKLTFKDICNGGMGSGFFVSQDGYIATNGHVGTANPKDLAIASSILLFSQGSTDYLKALLTMTSLKQSDLSGKSEKEQLGIMIDAMYNISESSFSETNSVNNLLVLLNTKVPDITALLKYTSQRKAFPESDNLKKAELVGYNYRALDNLPVGSGYKGSDVALLKVSGTNYPVVQLGNIDDVSSGSTMYILGFPANATNAALIDDSTAIVTLTKGTVSSIKNSTGSSKKLIETDTIIGHGNSGGPAFSEAGNVIGISTYISWGQFDATYNYVRDIADFKDLLSSKSISLDTNSKTQSEWSKGVDNFYTSHYSKALASFKKVKEYYAFTTNIDKFIKESEDAIAAGKDVQDFPILWVIIGGSVALLGIGATVFLMIRHRKKHDLYNGNVAIGTIQPMQPGSAPQQVTLSSIPTAVVQSQQPQNQTGAQANPSIQTPQSVSTPNPSSNTTNSSAQPIDYFGKKQ